ncbi:hypothetical protein GCM10022225_23290 [Plantactinospora mayteni]|uniref:Uncharacterized protein n=1 Tax=Plantactinospora mayteni TaxID=566021 RepID=A0ABQ4EPE3_9ACTN|nr:hypothetical protein Pma05_30860 [Plantactinospora mayteni]
MLGRVISVWQKLDLDIYVRPRSRQSHTWRSGAADVSASVSAVSTQEGLAKVGC